jgi:hypothetical protein
MSTYTDIVDRQRIAFTYDMWIDVTATRRSIALTIDQGDTRLRSSR